MTRISSPRTPGGGAGPLDQALAAVRQQPLLFVGVPLLLLVVLWLLLLPPLSLLRGDGWRNAGEQQLVRARGEAPKPPDGFQLASPMYEIRSSTERGVGPAVLTVPLGEGRGGRGMALYTWTGDRWQRLGNAEVVADGRAARGQVDRVPDNVTVLRRAGAGFQRIGILPPGAVLHPDAEKVITVRSPADFAPGADGSVAGSPPAAGGDDQVAVVPVVRATAGADAQAVNALLASEPARAAHVAALVRLVQGNRLDGLDLEYTALEPNLGPAYVELLGQLAAELHKTGQTLTVTLPVPRREGNAWNTFGYDWKEIGRVADYLRLVPERDQSAYRRTMRDALNYITGQVDAKKIILTVSPLAAEKSEQGVQTLTAHEALSIAARISVRDRDRLTVGADVTASADNLNREGAGAAGLIWDATAAAVSFIYQSGDSLRTVWIENVFSVAFKLEFAQLWGLGGVAVDDAGDALGTSNLWPAIDQFAKNGQPTLQQPNSGMLRPEWLVDGKRAEFGKATVTWKSPEPGEHSISLIIGDGVMRVANQVKVTLRTGPAPSPGPSPSPTPRR